MLTLDGSSGEGGGQILRTALALSMITGRAFHIHDIRAGRRKPGLLRQHLTGVKAAKKICGARVDGMTLSSGELVFRPGPVVPGKYHFAIGTAGSTSLVLQAVLPALMVADGPSELVLEGGTHNTAAPPFDFLVRTFAPVIARMGPRLELSIQRYGFFPAGGGRITVRIVPAPIRGITLETRGKLVDKQVRALIANLSPAIARRELAIAARGLDLAEDQCHIRSIREAQGPGNAILLDLICEEITETICGFGDHGTSAEDVARGAVAEAVRFLEADVPVGEHLADQLQIPFALAGGGSFKTLAPSTHFETNAETIRAFTGTRFMLDKEHGNAWRVHIKP